MLSDQINRFCSWDRRKRIIGLRKFAEKINLKNGRYTVELPFEVSHPGMPDNFALCQNRLESLKKRLDSDDELKRSYNEVFQDQLKCGVIEKVEDPGIAGETTYSGIY